MEKRSPAPSLVRGWRRSPPRPRRWPDEHDLVGANGGFVGAQARGTAPQHDADEKLAVRAIADLDDPAEQAVSTDQDSAAVEL
ncbi:hypothetical protein R3Q15_09560 [Gordonia amicalis]|uniref:Uncharacterized protein n=1 Tax=Gordonia amicalis TaxID=89053 RepID=A0AAE4R2H0_9ACTN|nr:hypothetical protein [Gordonia amicalis]MDV6312128.1 hypothetical protein [Gordonia amicalis]